MTQASIAHGNDRYHSPAKRLGRALATILALAMLVLPAAPAAASHPGTTVTVCPASGAGCDFTDIQAAIDHANPGDTVSLAAGRYTVTSSVVVNKAVTLRGPKHGTDPRPSFGSTRVPDHTATEAVVDGGGTVGTIVRIAAAGVTLDGFQVANGAADLVRSNEADNVTAATIRNLIVFGSSADEGIQLRDCDGCLVERSHVFATGADGINMCCGSSGSTIRDNEVNETFSGHGAIYVYDVTAQTIANNLVYGPRGNAGITVGRSVTGSTDVTISGNEVSGRGGVAGILLRAGVSDVDIIGNTIVDNGNPYDTITTSGVRVETPTTALVHVNGNDIAGNEAGVTYTIATPPALDATGNWWGHASGPAHGSNPGGTGDSVSNNVDFGAAAATALRPPPEDPLGSGAANVYVSPTGSDAAACTSTATACKTPHMALRKVGPSGTVHFAAGVYPHTRGFMVPKSGVTLRGAKAGEDPRPVAFSSRTAGGATESIVDGSGVAGIIGIDADDVTVDGLELRNSPLNLVSATPATGLIVRNSILHNDVGADNLGIAVVLNDCVGCSVARNHAYALNRSGIAIVRGTDNTVEFNQVADYPYHYGAIWMLGHERASVLGNHVSGATNANGVGILLECRTAFPCDDHTEVVANRVQNNTGAAGIKVCARGTSDVTLLHNRIHDNGLPGVPATAGVMVNDHFGTGNCDDANVVANDNEIEGNEAGFVYATSAAFAGPDLDATGNWWGSDTGPTHASNPSGTGDSVSDHVDFDPFSLVPIPGGIVRIQDPLDEICPGPNRFFAIQDAIDCAAAGATVLVETGLYEASITMPVNGLTVCSTVSGGSECNGDRSTTIIRGTGATVVTVTGNDATLDGFTVENPGFTATSPATLEPTLVRVSADRFTLTDSVLQKAAAPLEPGQSRRRTMGVFISGGSDGAAIEDTLIRDLPASRGPQGACAASPCQTLGINNPTPVAGLTVRDSGIDIAGDVGIDVSASNAVIEDNTIAGDLDDPTDEFGILLRDGTTNYRVSGNAITDWDHAGIYVAERSDGPGLIEGNTISGSGRSGMLVSNEDPGSTVTVRDNDIGPQGLRGVNLEGSIGSVFEGNRISLDVINAEPPAEGSGAGIWSQGARNARFIGNTFTGSALTAIRATAIPSGADLFLRHNVFRPGEGNATALHLTGSTPGRIDARLNDWGVYNWRALPSRVRDEGTGNTVAQIPFQLADATAEPPLPAVPGHIGTQTTCDAHADAEFWGGSCRFLTVQAAIDFAAPGSTVFVPMSIDDADPTPHAEAVRIHQNVSGSALTGVRVCGSVARLVCASTVEAGRWSHGGMAWEAAPRHGAGTALHKAPGGFANTTLTLPVDLQTQTQGMQIDDIERMSFDFTLTSGGCGGGPPRMTVVLSTTAGSKNVHVYGANYPSCTAALSAWIHEDLVAGAGHRWDSSQVGGPGFNASGTKAQAHTAALTVDPNYRITAVRWHWDTGAPDVWVDNVRVNDWFLRHASDETCFAPNDAPSPCPNRDGVANTVLDGTTSGPTGVDIDASAVTLEGFTIRRRVPVNTSVRNVDVGGSSGAVVRGNAIVIDGAACDAAGATAGTCSPSATAVGVWAGSAASGARIEGNRISATRPSGAVSGGTHGIAASLASGSRVESNTISGWSRTGADLAAGGPSPFVGSNAFHDNGDGIRACATGATVSANVFTGSRAALAACAGGTGVVMRNNSMDMSNNFGVRFPSGVTGIVIDARLNYWGVSDATLLRFRVLDENPPPSGNQVLQTPFNPA